MIVQPGISLWAAGVVIGPLVTFLESNNEPISIREDFGMSISSELSGVDEIEAFRMACDGVMFQLEELYEHTKLLVGESNAQIFRAHQMILEDSSFCGEIEAYISTESCLATEAIGVVSQKWIHFLEDNATDDLQKERALDLAGIAEELTQFLSKRSNPIVLDSVDGPVILVADRISPSQLMKIPREKIMGIVMQSEAIHSHVAILANSMRIPTLMGCQLSMEHIEDGMRAMIDFQEGLLVVEPSEELCRKALRKQSRIQEEKTSVLKEKLMDSKMSLLANVNSVEEVSERLYRAVDGIGLFRTEFLYMNRNAYPTEEEQYQIYKEVLLRMHDKKVVIRTMDLGDDKSTGYLQMPKENNPSLGYRGIRLSLDRKDVFKTQLKAMLRAAVYGQMQILFPMITSEQEVDQIYEMIEGAAAELEKANIDYKIPDIGLMIETPAAVLISEELTEKVDFFSIGTNDLVQYTLAADRQSSVPIMSKVYDAHHPAVLKLIQMTVENAHKAGIKVGICGELASDESLTEWFDQIGVDSLSVAPVLICE